MPARYSKREAAAIRDHLSRMIVGCDNALAKLRSIPRPRPDFVEANIAYWKHARQALRWALSRVNPGSKETTDAGSAAI